MCVVKQKLKEGKEKNEVNVTRKPEKNMLGTSVNCTSIYREPNNAGLIFYVSKCFFLRLKVFFYVKITEFSGNGRDVFFWPLSLSTRDESEPSWLEP